MSPRGLAAWPPWALLLLWLPGCDPLRGPSKVTGTVGGSLSVQCHYDEKWKDSYKSWCRQSAAFCYDVVKTSHSNREVRTRRTSLSDHPASLSFTVTMERLTLQDAGSYECRVDTPWHEGFDPYFRVEVAVLPALATASSSEGPTSTQGPPTIGASRPSHTWPVTTREDTPSPHLQPGSLVFSVHLLLLVLKVLLLLSLLSAVLWVNRPQRSSVERRRQQDSEHQ